MRYIHLLYVPTMACNMQCRYCYLEENTVDSGSEKSPLQTLQYAVSKFRDAGVMPFNISLHGGEVTTLPAEDFRALIEFIHNYYRENEGLITGAGFRIGSPHIKTNLYDLNRHIDTIRDYSVSVSGSLDLPFSLHDTYRVTKGGERTLGRILQNIEMLRSLPGKKKVSATIFREHYLRTDEIIEDIRFLDRETCLDMNDFNFMIGFDYNSGGLLTALTQEEQVDFYNRMREAFEGTGLQQGLDTAWFAEFGPDYCTNCDNCGDKFFLLERNGDIYSCVRGQKHEEFYYGNIYREDVGSILTKAQGRIQAAHDSCGFDPACASCGYLYLCKTGCPFVKTLYHTPGSYTCLLQKELYRDMGYQADQRNQFTVYEYLRRMHPGIAEDYQPPRIPMGVPPLPEIIRRDPKLKYIYDPNAFLLVLNGEEFRLQSQILRSEREIICITEDSEAVLYVRKEVLEAESEYPANNSLYIQLLSSDMIVYGDEGRTKQRHIANEMVYRDVLAQMASDREECYQYDLMPFLRRYGKYLSRAGAGPEGGDGLPEAGDGFFLSGANNIFFTTAALRDVHYSKQKNNAFYHMQAMDLPFQNIEFYYFSNREVEEMIREQSKDI